MSARLVLGTVQFGMPYGISNRGGQVSPKEIAAILEEARDGGISTLDTAVAYRDAEQRLGAAGVRRFDIVTKLPPLPAECDDVVPWVQRTFAESRARLGIDRVYGLLLHRSRDLAGARGTALRDALFAEREAGHVGKIGVSIYDPEELDELRGTFEPQLVQAPFNVFDRRLETSGWLARLRSLGVEVHVRSVFLQGLLLMAPASRPVRFAQWTRHFARWDEWLRESGLSPLRACLAFALSRPDISIVVGVESRAQLLEIISAALPATVAPDSLALHDADLINPARWNAA